MDEILLEENDYLDLYLLAGSLKDKSWQKEIIEKLKHYHPDGKIHREMSLTIQKLWKEYRMINIEILDLYHQLRNHTENEKLNGKISLLENKRRFLIKKIHAVENKLQHHNS
jgi:hypothetical protein